MLIVCLADDSRNVMTCFLWKIYIYYKKFKVSSAAAVISALRVKVNMVFLLFQLVKGNCFLTELRFYSPVNPLGPCLAGQSI